MFAIHIATKNRKSDLIFTLQKIAFLLDRNDIVCVVYDDGSTDGTYDAVSVQFPSVQLLRNEMSKGYLYCRNHMLNQASEDYVISLDDDAHFLSENPLETIESYFAKVPQCGLIAFRIFWGKNPPENTHCSQEPERVKGFVGCGHVWRMKAWKEIPNYPEWFEFYGEEDFASLQLFKINWEVHYLPKIFVQHRVDLKNRSIQNKDFGIRYRNSIRSGWYLYFIFYPKAKISKMMVYSLYMQFKTKIIKGNFKVILPLFLAIKDLIFNMPQCLKSRNTLTKQEYKSYLNLNQTKIFWKP